MRNYIHLGPLAIKVSNRNLAHWGFPRARIGGLSIATWDSNGRFMPVSYHPRSSITWLWATRLYRDARDHPASLRHNTGGMRIIALPFGVKLRLDWQRRVPRTRLVES